MQGAAEALRQVVQREQSLAHRNSGERVPVRWLPEQIDPDQRSGTQSAPASHFGDPQLQMGGIDLAPSAREAVLEHANAAEWQWIEERIRTEARKSREWARSALVELLAEGLERCGREGDAAALIRELGTPEQQAHLLIDTGQI